MAKLTGTASNHNDLLTKLKNFLVNVVGWTELEWTPGVSSTDLAMMILRAPGALSGHEFFLYVDTNFNVGQGAYGWAMRAFADYDDEQPPGAQELASPVVWFNTWANDIPFWFYANGRRVIVVAKVNTSYVSMYAGLLLPFALPTEYPKPFYLAGNYPIFAPHDVQNSRNRFIADPGDGAAWYLTQDLTQWRKTNNHVDGTTDVAFARPPQSFVWPHRSLLSPLSNVGAQHWTMNGMSFMRPNNNGEMPTFLAHVVSYAERRLIGAMEGVYGAPGFGRTSEQLLTMNAKNFRLFQNVFRTTGRDFMAIEEL